MARFLLVRSDCIEVPSFFGGLFFALHSFALTAIDLITYTPTHTGKMGEKSSLKEAMLTVFCAFCVSHN